MYLNTSLFSPVCCIYQAVVSFLIFGSFKLFRTQPFYGLTLIISLHANDVCGIWHTWFDKTCSTLLLEMNPLIIYVYTVSAFR